MAKKNEENVTAPAATEPELAQATPAWDTTVKLGAIEEANYVAIGAVVSGVDKATGEITLRTRAETQPHGRSREVVEG